MSPMTKCDTIAPNLEIHEIRFRHINPDVRADLWYDNGIVVFGLINYAKRI